MSKTPPGRGDQPISPGEARRSTQPNKTNRISSSASTSSRTRTNDRYDDYEEERPSRASRQRSRNTAPVNRSGRPRSSSSYSRYEPPRRDVFPIIMGGIVGALIVGFLIVVYLLMTSRGNSPQTAASVQTNPSLNADSQAVPTMAQSSGSEVNVVGTQTMAARRPAGGLGTPMPDEGNAHVDEGQAITYKNYPPSSGTHYGTTATYGFSEVPIPDGQSVHSLEHGAIVLYYKPDLSDTVKQQLKETYTKLPLGKYGKVKMVIAPYTNMTTPMAIAAWDRLMLLDSYNYDEIQAFYQQYVDNGPEDVP